MATLVANLEMHERNAATSAESSEGVREVLATL
jgi:hypothetical protein